MAPHLLRGIAVERGARRRQAHEDAFGEARRDAGQRFRVGAAHVAVAQGADQGGQGLGEMADVRVERRPVGEHPHDHGQGVRQTGQQALLGQRGDVGQRARGRRVRLGLGLRRRQYGRPPPARLGDPHRQLRLPAQPPGLPERARAPP